VYAYKYACITAQNTRSNWKLPGGWCEEEARVCMPTSMHALQRKTREATGNLQVVGARRRQSVYAYKYACITAQNTRSNWKLPGGWCEEEAQVCMPTSMHALQHKTRKATGKIQMVGARRRHECVCLQVCMHYSTKHEKQLETSRWLVRGGGTSVYACKYACITAQNTKSNWKNPDGWCEEEAQGRVPTSAGSSIAWSSLILMILIITICSPQWRRGF